MTFSCLLVYMSVFFFILKIISVFKDCVIFNHQRAAFFHMSTSVE